MKETLRIKVDRVGDSNRFAIPELPPRTNEWNPWGMCGFEVTSESDNISNVTLFYSGEAFYRIAVNSSVPANIVFEVHPAWSRTLNFMVSGNLDVTIFATFIRWKRRDDA